MSRYNIFFPIHKGLRVLLYETAIRLQQTDFMNEDESAETIELVKTVIELFESHADKEDSYVFPAIAAYEPSVVAVFEKEHVEDHELGDSLQKWITAFEYAAAPRAKQTIGDELTKCFIQFLTFNLKHMSMEEKVISPILWRYYSDEELHGITLKIIQNVAPQQMAFFSRWMMRGLNNPEICLWLKGVKNTAPQPVFESLLSVAQNELNPTRWSFVQESLTEGAMVA